MSVFFGCSSKTHYVISNSAIFNQVPGMSPQQRKSITQSKNDYVREVFSRLVCAMQRCCG